MNNETHYAFGAPGIPGKWTSSAKSGIGKAIDASNPISFTISHGILNEVYYPREDNACTRDMELLVTNGTDFFSEEKRDVDADVQMLEPGVPAYLISSTCKDKRYTLRKEIIADPLRNTVLQKIKFTSSTGPPKDYQVFVLLAPHISNQGGGNTGWTSDYKGVPMLFAEREGITLALACSLPFVRRSVGYVSSSDGYQDISTHRTMEWTFTQAEAGNIALTAQIGIGEDQEEFTVALSFGRNYKEAAVRARASLIQGFDAVKELYVSQWQQWHSRIQASTGGNVGKLFRNSIAVMRMHEATHFPGAVIASLSIPWGNTKGDGNIGGYHLVWPRDLVECSGGFLAFGAHDDAMRVLNYLMATQEADGHWPQNMWLEGDPYWNGLQLDQLAFPILLMGQCSTKSVLTKQAEKAAWDCVRKAATFLLRYGPLSPQERWEEESGISISTLATCIAALLVAADFAIRNNDKALAQYCFETADYWNSNIDNWLYVTDTPMARQAGVDGYYIRINPSGCRSEALKGQNISLKNRPDDKKNMPVNELISVDALCLVRFGLRQADDPRIRNTIKVIDAHLKVETPSGPCWHRYNNDGYGEHEDGTAFDGTGIGRLWPLLTGERAHYEIAAGNMQGAQELMQTLEGLSDRELLSEQVWDSADMPEKELFFGRPSGSAMPLVWAHAEYVKLCASLREQKVFDRPTHTVTRYLVKNTKSKLDIWRFMLPCRSVRKGNSLRLETRTAARVHWSVDNWATVQDTPSKDTGFGLYYTDIPANLLSGETIDFTFFWIEANRWENKNYSVTTLNQKAWKRMI
ncbi:glycoside hydrolase family 15 protein [Spirosoma pollinicola]|uniref:Glucan 1,4-alpha-glucosidase n=1 Tax=Spirosoma pollinicola TaxID=2057025 RepID=A0A2K8Z7L2_9BACT|nr:glycoside hydrolase family 15 protein [Spirosoma pollinicola]AUD05862.1 glucan 1,4-alpha-glucosidase [Spirosoma pollinicola]